MSFIIFITEKFTFFYSFKNNINDLIFLDKNIQFFENFVNKNVIISKKVVNSTTN